MIDPTTVMIRIALVAVLLASAFADFSSAQTQPGEPRHFLAAGVVMDRGYYQFVSEPNSWRPGVTVDAGWQLSARRSFRVSAQIMAFGDRTFDDTDFTLSGDGRVTTTSKSQTALGTALFGLHYRTDRKVRVTSLWGLSAYTSAERVVRVGRERTFVGGTTISSAPGVAIGLEASLATSPRKEVVAQAVAHLRLSRDVHALATVMPTLVFRWRN